MVVHCFETNEGNNPHLMKRRQSPTGTTFQAEFLPLEEMPSAPTLQPGPEAQARPTVHAASSTKLPSFTVRQGMRPVVLSRLRSALLCSCTTWMAFCAVEA